MLRLKLLSASVMVWINVESGEGKEQTELNGIRTWSQCFEGGEYAGIKEQTGVTQGFSWMIYVKHLIACDSHEIPTKWTERVTDFI